MTKNVLLSVFALMLLTLSTALAQERAITGKVTSAEDGISLPGVNVVVKGTTNGTVTDADGNYRIGVSPSNGGSLVFSFIGFSTTEVEIGERTVVDVSLKADVTELGEVVVTGLGIERQSKTLGFSVREVKNDELTVGRTTNLVNALSGKIAGVRIAGSNGMTGSSSAIFIRGFTTFTGSNQPLFVVDGIPINNDGGGNAQQTGVSNSNRAIDINQDDIESMTILKGPAAAVLYGSRAAAGAIMITTKKGKGGEKNKAIEYTASYNINEVNRFPDYQNQYAQGTSLTSTGLPIASVYQPNADQSNWGPLINGQSVPSSYSVSDRALFGLPDTQPLTAYPNNIKDLFRTGNNMQHTIAFSGGNDKSTFRVSYNNLQDKGFLENNQLQRNSFRFDGRSQLTSKLQMGVSLNYINNTSQRSQIGNQLSNPLFRGWFLPRNYNLQGDPSVRPDGSQVYFNGNTDNPYWTLRNNLYNDEINRIIGNINLSYDFNEWASVTYKIGTDAFVQRIKTVDAIGARGQANWNVAGVGAVGDQMIYNQETSSYLNFNFKKKISDFNFSLLVGNEINLRVGQNLGFIGNTLSTRGFDNINDALNFTPLANGKFRSNLVGFYADFQTNYKNWLFVGLTGRNDISSTFKPDRNSYFYPSVTTSLVLTDAVPTIKGNIVDFIKLKANWAKVGREAPIYSTDTYYLQANPGDGFGPQLVYPFLGRVGRTLDDAAGNPQLSPEFTRSFEFGTEATLLKNKLRLEVNYFNTRTTDIILGVPVAAASGFTTQARNAGVLETSGWEVSLSLTPIKTNSFQWMVDANWTRLRNNVISLAPGVQNIAIGGFTTAQSRIVAGQPYGVIYANTLLRNDQGKLVVNGTNGLPIIDTRGPQLVADPNPDWVGGITNTFQWKGITASFLFDFRSGGQILSRIVNDLRRTGSAAETAELPRFDASGIPIANYVIDGVRNSDGAPNTTAITAQQYWSNMYSFNVPGMGVFDATSVRLREAAINYTLPRTLLEKTPFSKVEFGLNGRNLLLWTNVPHIDPETNLNGASNSQGLEFNAMPNARTYGAVLKLTF